MIRELAKRVLPRRTRQALARRRRSAFLKSQQKNAFPPVGEVHFGDLQRTTPISDLFGFERGQPIDRYYIESFFRRYGGDGGVIRGRVLEVEESLYADKFGDDARIDRIDVLDLDPLNPYATVVADLMNATDLPSNAFDCVICTQTLFLIYDIDAAVGTLHRILKPGGTTLVTVPGVSRICRPHTGRSWGDYWRLTGLSARRLFEDRFGAAGVTVETYGSVLTATAFLYGLAAEELSAEALEAHDPDYEVTIGVKAVKNGPA
jgi:SAM-dependent methyltransferase